MKYIYESKFFTLGGEKLSKEQLEIYCRMWWPIQLFSLGLVTLTGTVAAEIFDNIAKGNLKDAALLEKISKLQAPAAVDEMGLGRDSGGVMHHLLFAEQVSATTSLSYEELNKQKLHTKSNIILRVAIRESVKNVVTGLCMMHVVETIAPKLFLTQQKIFLAAGCPEKLLKHSNLHVTLEQNHAEEASQFLILLKQLAPPEEIDLFISNYSEMWRNFLDEVYKTVQSE